MLIAATLPSPRERHPLGLRVARSRVQRPLPASLSPINILPDSLAHQLCIPPPSARVAPSTTRYRTPSVARNPPSIAPNIIPHHTPPRKHATLHSGAPCARTTMPSILIQAGHSAAYPPHLPGGGGAQGEADWTAQLAARTADYLQASPAPPTTTIVGSWAYYTPPTTPGTPPILHVAPPPSEAASPNDYTLFISLHYNGSTTPNTSGCNAGRAVNDPAAAQADEFIAIWRDIYPTVTGIPLDPTVPISSNVQYYYAFVDTSPTTPGVLIEHGYGAPGQGDHTVLYDNIDLIAQADVRAICAFLKIDPPTFTAQPQPPSPTPPADQLCVYVDALRLANWQKHEMEAYIRDYPPGHRQSVDDAATREGNAPITLMLRWAQDHFDAGETAP
jgi:N-acetylmuramoyl-L-alanine amidase